MTHEMKYKEILDAILTHGAIDIQVAYVIKGIDTLSRDVIRPAINDIINKDSKRGCTIPLIWLAKTINIPLNEASLRSLYEDISVANTYGISAMVTALKTRPYDVIYDVESHALFVRSCFRHNKNADAMKVREMYLTFFETCTYVNNNHALAFEEWFMASALFARVKSAYASWMIQHAPPDSQELVGDWDWFNDIDVCKKKLEDYEDFVRYDPFLNNPTYAECKASIIESITWTQAWENHFIVRPCKENRRM